MEDLNQGGIVHSIVRLWTIQDEPFWEICKQRGEIAHRDTQEYLQKFSNVGWEEAYDWMRQQMNARIPGYTGLYPVWAWAKRPDMRGRRRYGLKGDKLVIIEFEADSSRVLISGFQAWHSVLTNCPVPLTREEDEDYESLTREQIVEEWQRIFDIELLKKSVFYREEFPQVCVEMISMDQIINIRHVTI